MNFASPFVPFLLGALLACSTPGTPPPEAVVAAGDAVDSASVAIAGAAEQIEQHEPDPVAAPVAESSSAPAPESSTVEAPSATAAEPAQTPEAPPAPAKQTAGTPPNRIRDLLTARRDELAARLAASDLPQTERDALTASHARFESILKDPAEFRAQVLLAEVVEQDGAKKLVRSGWRDDNEYFYPASTVKLCGAVAALERVNELRRGPEPKFSESTALAYHPTRKSKSLEADDPSNLEGGKITLQQLIRRALLVSDNEAFNRLYDFCGQNWLNERMWRAGLNSVRISHRLDLQLGRNENKRTPLIELRYADGAKMLAEQWGTLDLDLKDRPGIYVGKEHFQSDERVNKPMSFYTKNAFALGDALQCLVRIARPDVALERGEPFDLTDAQRELLMDALSTYPGDSPNPRYERARYPDDYCKFFLAGLARAVPKERLKVYNRIGLAYGFATDVAYVVDTQTQRSFFLAATIYANSDGVVDDDQYDYETVGIPWLADVAEIVVRDVWKGAK